MSLRSELLNFLNSSYLPDYDSLMALLDKSVSLLENEDSSYRPRERSGERLSGGLLNFCGMEERKPVIVIPDIHARGYFLMHILDWKIQINGNTVSVLEACEKKLVFLVCVGDLFHSELRCYERWKKAYAQFRNGVVISDEMICEMLENLNLLQMVLSLKLACPESFHCLKGNHENVLNEEGRGNHSFYKMAAEGEMFFRFMTEKYDDALVYLFSCFEHSLPLCAVFPNLVVSHAEPAFALTKTKIINYRNWPDVVLALTWTGNGVAEPGSVSKSIRNLVGKDCRNVVWIGGHRPVSGKYAMRQRKKYIQIHNPDEENVALVMPDRKFDPERDIFSVA